MKSYAAVLFFRSEYANRVSFVISPQGKVIYHFKSLNPSKHVAEQFIERAATRSSMTGETYQVRCPSSSALQDCSRWLLDELARYRGRSAQQR